MKKNHNRMSLKEEIIRQISSQVMRQILSESRGIKSAKLYDIMNEHGGFAKDDLHHKTCDLHNITDDEVIGVISHRQLQDIQVRSQNSDGLKSWAKRKGYDLRPQDDVDYIKLQDGNYLLLIIINSRFDRVANTGDEGWKQYWDKTQQREKNRRNDGKRQYQWNNTEAEDAFHNPYFKEWSKDSRERKMNKAREMHKR